jgi:hypothetical protein
MYTALDDDLKVTPIFITVVHRLNFKAYVDVDNTVGDYLEAMVSQRRKHI